MKTESKQVSWLGLWILAGMIMLPTVVSGGTRPRSEMMNAAPTQSPSTYEIPAFKGPGQLATIWSAGPIGPYGDALVITSGQGSEKVNIDRPSEVRWQTPRELIVEQWVSHLKAPFRTRLVRLDRSGDVLGVLSEGEGLSLPQPAPGGRWVAVQHSNENAVLGLQIRDLDAGFRVVGSYPRSSTFDPLFPAMAWSPDAMQLAASTMVDDPHEKGTLWPRLVLLNREKADDIRRLPDGPGGTDRESRGVTPLFWTVRGLYARSSRGLLSCDPKGSGCELVYDPGDGRSILKGTAFGKSQALLLVQGVRRDPLEVRAKEIHEVNLKTGKATVLMRAPDGVFINDIDWIGDPMP